MYARKESPPLERRVAPRRGILAPPPGLDRHPAKHPNQCVNHFLNFFLSEIVLHYKDKSIDPDNATEVGRRIKDNVCLCSPCVIVFMSCHVGLGTIGQSIANSTRCKVFAPNGFCSPNYDDPMHSPIRPTSTGYQNPYGSLSGDKWIEFNPR